MTTHTDNNNGSGNKKKERTHPTHYIRKSSNWNEINAVVVVPGLNCDKSGTRSILRIMEDLEGLTEIVTYGHGDIAIPFTCQCAQHPCRYEVDVEQLKKNKRVN